MSKQPGVGLDSRMSVNRVREKLSQSTRSKTETSEIVVTQHSGVTRNFFVVTATTAALTDDSL